jgi:hypothetical protein
MALPHAPLQGAAFYTKFPRIDHTPGDIWSGLVCDKTLSPTQISGVVLTPACDLSNNKVETTTYLPVVSIRQYFSTAAVLPSVYKRILGLCQALEIQPKVWMAQRFELPAEDDVAELEVELSRVNPRHALRVPEVMAGIDLLRAILNRGLVDVSVATVKTFFGDKQAGDMLQKLLKNSYSSDVHFLPHDGLMQEYSAIPHASLVLFRYPCTTSLQLLDHAIETPESMWSEHAKSLDAKFPGAASLSPKRPIKLATLEPRFFADLLTRYVSLMIRLGAPSFEQAALSKMLQDLE